ncbi:uncharacterized protein LOC105702550 [Orussus abietinus]|uniref:uncharacterized protein LOC105702550 n=1 Tax=Orussus abietinus TaxID=222816 RepID=UPI000626AF9E|nr:uncharacterized protein LOC105702550 [Orussus abietinus]
MISRTLVVVLCLCSSSLEQPMFFTNSFKGLEGLTVPRNQFSGDVPAVYYHDQTVAVVELGFDNELHNCDLVEIYEPREAVEVLRNLSVLGEPREISFQDMTTLMQQCDQVDVILQGTTPTLPTSTPSGENQQGVNPLTLFSGILPGTKWCGSGDIATNYHDLGQEARIDRCCRTHDHCPAKVRAQRTRYDVTNYSLYTKSHCNCDEGLYQCLKTANHPTANVMGVIYFNIVRVPCLEDIPESERAPRGPTKRFRPPKMRY